MKVWAWVKEKAVWVASAVGGLLLLLVGAGWIWQRRRGRVPSAAQVESAKFRLGRLNEIQAEMVGRVGEKDLALDQLEREKTGFKRTLVAARVDVEALSDAEVVAEFARLYPAEDEAL